MTLHCAASTLLLVGLLSAAGCGGVSGAGTGHAGEEHEGEEHEGEGHEGEGHEGEDKIVLGPEAISRAGIRWAKLEPTALADELVVPAEVALDPNRAAHVTLLTRARILEVKASLGASVKKGDVLAIVESSDLGEARASVVEFDARVRLAEANVKRARELVTAGVAPSKALIDAEAELRVARAARSAAGTRAGIYGAGGGAGAKTMLVSPIDGTVVDRHATVGEVADPDEPLFLVADLSISWVFGRVYERDVGRVREGQPAKLVLDAYPGREWACTLDYVAGALDEETRTLPVRIRLPNTDGALKPGLFGALRIGVGEPAPALAVPADAVQRLGPRTLLFVRAADGSFVPRDVRLGRTVGGLVEVVEGVAAGEEVAVAGTFALKGEMLKGALSHEH